MVHHQLYYLRGVENKPIIELLLTFMGTNILDDNERNAKIQCITIAHKLLYFNPPSVRREGSS